MYNGNWVADSRGTQDGVGNSGPAFQHTLHRAPGSFGSLAFTFDGSAVDVVGKLTAGSNADGTEPTWECLVDGQAIDNAAVQRDQNNQVLCSVAGLQEGAFHYLTLQTSSDLVWVDYIEYTPTSWNTWNPYRTPGSFVSIPNSDPTFSFDNLWVRPPSDVGFAGATNVGATFNTTFLGNSLIWYGVIPSGASGNATGTYSIDEQPPVTFVVNHSASGAGGEHHNQVFFETPLLTYDPHTLSVTYTANGGIPFTLDRLVVRDQMDNGFSTASSYYSYTVVAPTAWASGSAVAGWPASEGAIYNSRPMSGGAIAATVIGSVLGFALIVAALLFFWRRRRSRRAAAQMPAQGFVPPHPGDEKAIGKADTSSVFSRIREKIKKEKEELDYAKPPVETEQLPAYKARNSGVQNEVVDRV